MNALSLPFLRPLAPYGTLVLRLGVGIVMVAHGMIKLQSGVAGVAGWFASLGIPAAGLLAWVVIVVELIGGVCVILGLATRLWALLFAVVLIVAMLTAKVNAPLLSGREGGAGKELDIALLTAALALALLGSGGLSLDKTLGIEE